MIFSKEFLINLVNDDHSEDAEIVEDILEEGGRWTVGHDIIFRYKDKFYQSYYRTGATENCDERPYEFDEDEIECPEMHQVEKVVKVWEKV